MSNNFGTDIDPAHYTEIADPDNPGQVKRPPAGQVLQVQDALTQVTLPDTITTQTYGYWALSLDDTHPAIKVSPDGGLSWIGPLFSGESQIASSQAGATAAAASAVAGQAAQDAHDALTIAQSGGVKFRDLPTNTDILGPVFTLPGIFARDRRDNIKPSEVTDPAEGSLQPVALSGRSADLSDANEVNGALLLGQAPDGTPAIPAAFLGNLATGVSIVPVFQNVDGSWDPRTAHSVDSGDICYLIPRDVTKSKPPLGTDGVSYYEPNPALGIPGDWLMDIYP